MKIAGVEINKKLFIAVIVVVVLAIIGLIVDKLYINRYNKYKIDKDENFIYTSETYSKSKSYIPYINIDNDFCKTLNSEIEKLALDYKDSTSQNNSFTYRYNVNNNYVSLVIILKSLDDNDQLQFEFITYVFDLDDGGKALSDSEILQKFNITEDEVSEKISTELVKIYDDEINENIIPSECNFKDCYLSLRKIDDYLDDVNYYIENGSLVVYKTFEVYSKYNEEDYFTRDDFKFYIK